jgi:hypothetical protein
VKDKNGAVKNKRRRSIVGELNFVSRGGAECVQDKAFAAPRNEKCLFIYIRNLMNSLDPWPAQGQASRMIEVEICK